MQTNFLVKKLLILAGLIALTFGSYTLARGLREVWPASTASLPPLVRVQLPAQTVEGITASIESYYADALRIVFRIRIEGKNTPYGIDNISLTNSQNEELNTGYGMFADTADPSVMVVDMVPAYAMAEKRLDGQLSISVTPTEASKPAARFHFDLDLPVHPAQTYIVNKDGSSFSTPGGSDNSYAHPILLERVVISPAFTWFYLCYNKPDEADWMIGHQAVLDIQGHTWGIDTYNLLYDSSMGDGSKGGEPGWTHVGNYQRCVKIGFQIGSEVNLPTKLTLTIPTLEQSMPEVIPQEQLEAAYPKLLAQGIDLEWHTEGHGAYPEWKKLPSGMDEQEAYQKFIEALGYTYTGPWIFSIYLEPRDTSQPIFSTSAYGAATPIPVPGKSALVETIPGRIRSFTFSPDQKTIALASSEGIALYDLESRKQIRVLNKTENFFSVDWSSNGKNLAAGGLVMEDPEAGKPHLSVWDTSTWQVIFEPALDDSMTDTLYGDVAWSPDSRYLATSNGSMGVTTFDIQSGKVISRQDFFSGAISDISWSPDGSRLVATGDMAYAIRRWKMSTDESVRLFDQRASSSIAVEWSPDGKRIASGHFGGSVCFWTAETNECDGLIIAHQTATFSLTWSADGKRLATGGGVIRIWDTQTGLPLSAFGLMEKAIYTKLAWPKPNLLISLETGYGSESPTTVRFWDLTTGKILMEFQGESGELWQ